MVKWQEIWEKDGTDRLWTIPDRQVVDVAQTWKAAGNVRRVLDIGCGIGRHARLLASEGFEVYGSDHSGAAIEHCRRWLAAEQLGGEFWCGELDDIPYPDEFFDGVLAFNSIYHGDTVTVERVARLLHDKVRPAGRCFVTMPSRENRMYGRGEAVDAHTFISPGMFSQLFDGGGERGVAHHFSSEEEMRNLFCGFQFDALQHEELHLASACGTDGGVTWRRIPKAYFWRLIARRQ